MIPTISNNDDSSVGSHESTVDRISGTSKHELPAACTVCSCSTMSSQVDKRMTRLPNTFMPGNFDVICAKGSNARNRMGNLLFRQKITEHAEAYGLADSKVAKSMVVSSVVDWIRRLSPDGGFVKQINGAWYEVGDYLARGKVGQGLREKNHRQYKSSNKAKRCRWSNEKKETIGNGEQKIMLDAIRSNQSIAERLDYLQDNRNGYLYKDMSDDSLLDLFTRNNCFVLNTIRSDQRIQESIKSLADC